MCLALVWLPLAPEIAEYPYMQLPLFLTTANEPGLLLAVVGKYQGYKIAFATWANMSDRELHTHIGMLVFVLTMVVLRQRLDSPWPWICAVFAEGLNEYFDSVAFGSWRWPDTRLDIAYTLVWPTLIFFCARGGLIKRR